MSSEISREMKRDLAGVLRAIKSGSIKANLKDKAWDYLISLVEEDLKNEY